MSKEPAPRSAEWTVEYAAERLGVSDRSILNYIKAKKIRAIKVGKKWFVDRASTESFAQAYGFRFDEEAIRPSKNDQDKAVPRPQSGAGSLPVVRKAKDDKSARSPQALACFRLCIEAFKMPLWSEPEPETLRSTQEIRTRINDLRFVVLENLGAGYYTFGRSKCACYDTARNAIGATVALVLSDTGLSERFAVDVLFLQQKVLPAFSSLIIKIERSQRGGQNRHEKS